VTPPLSIKKQLFSVIHGLYAARALRDRILKRSPTSSFEITSTKSSGIRFYIQIEKKHSSTVQKAIAAYIPDSKVSIVDYHPKPADKVIEFTQKNHYVLPISTSKAFDQQL